MRTRAVVLGVSLALVAALTPGSFAATHDVDRINICMHVSMTGAGPIPGPIPQHPARFGQFYFDYVNAELGGVAGRPVSLSAHNDQDYPAGARRDLACSRTDHLYVGPFGRDQIVSVARWAEDRQVPYLHGSVSETDTTGLEWSFMLGPSDEMQMTALADLLVDNADHLTGPADPVFGLVRLDAPSHLGGRDALAEQLGAHGYTLQVDRAIQKDEAAFAHVWLELLTQRVNVVVLFVDPYAAMRMLLQRPVTYAPALAGIAPETGWDTVAEFFDAATGRFVALHDPSPIYVDPRTEDPNRVAWGDDIQEFLRIFHMYSPDQNPPANDLDWAFYLRAKQLHRILEALDGDFSPEHIRDRLSSYQETSHDAFPSCPLDFSGGSAAGSGSWHLFDHSDRRWHQAALCADVDSTIDLADLGPHIDCGPAIRLSSGEPLRCEASAHHNGLRRITASATSLPGSTGSAQVDAGCRPTEELVWDLPVGTHDISVQAIDCTGRPTSASVRIVQLPAYG